MVLSITELTQLHERIALRMNENGQRYTKGRRHLIDHLSQTPEPIDMLTLEDQLPGIPRSSAYRSLSLFVQLGIVTRIASNDDSGYFEISEEYLGEHHHHALCESCGKVVDIETNRKTERALHDLMLAASSSSGFVIDTHRLELVGRCKTCVDS